MGLRIGGELGGIALEINKTYITEKKDEWIDDQLYKSYHFFFRTCKMPLMVVNNALEIIQINNPGIQLLKEIGKNTYKQSIKNALEQVPWDILYAQLELVRARGSYKDEWLLLDKKNTYRHIEFEAQYDGDNYYFTLRDITSFKMQEKDYSNSVNIFNDLFTLVTEGIMVFDRSGAIVEVNRAFMSFVMMNKQELMGRKFYDFLQEDSSRKWKNEWEVLRKIGKISSTVEWSFEGKSYFFKCTVYRNIYKDQYICVLKDVTEKKIIEFHLKSSEAIFRYVLGHVNEAIMLTNEKGYICEVNDVACRLFETERKELLGTRAEDLFVRKDRKYSEIRNAFIENGSVRREMFFKTFKEKELLIELSSKRIEGTGKAVNIYRNISERYAMERRLKRSESQFRRIFEGMLDGLLLWNDDGIVDINEAGLDVLNLKKKDIVLKTIPDLMEKYPQQKELIEKLTKDFHETKRKDMLEDKATLSFQDGNIRHVEIITKKNLFSGMNLTVIKDVTDKLIMQEQLRKSDTLNVVGELAAGIAHEIRNPMTALKGFIQLLEASVEEDYSNYFSIITSELQRIESIITEFLILAKPQALKCVEKDLNVIVKETIDLLNGEALLCDVMLIPMLVEGPIELYCEPNQLKQVLINLIKNAIESMKDGGNVTIRTESCTNQHVKLTVTDEGCGMSETKLKKLGEPFYTTKERGTGLGLMVSYKIIKEHGGEVEVISTEGVGTSFSIVLPCQCDMDCRVF